MEDLDKLLQDLQGPGAAPAEPPVYETPHSGRGGAAPPAEEPAADEYATPQDSKRSSKELLTSAASDLDSLMADLSSFGAPPPASAPAAPPAAGAVPPAKAVVAGARPVPQAPGTCAQCRKPIQGQLLSALGMDFHPDCFLCTHCGQLLNTTTYYEHEGAPYCSTDYHELFGVRCGYCNQPIIDKCISAIGKKWHMDHFFCAQCGCQFDAEGFMEKDGRPYCKKDYYNLFAPRCARCDEPIMENTVAALNKSWHTDCFTCKVCNCAFPGGQFYEHGGDPFCTTHYHEALGSLCAQCRQPIVGRCMLALGDRFHPQCFKCDFCNKVLSEGAFMVNKQKAFCNGCNVRLFVK